MTEDIQRRLERLMVEPFKVPPGILVMPAMSPPKVWPITMLMARVDTEIGYDQLSPCGICGYPTEVGASCVNCHVARYPEPRTTMLWPKSGAARIPWNW